MSLAKLNKKTKMFTVSAFVLSLPFVLQDCTSNLTDKVSNQNTLELEIEKDVKDNPPKFSDLKGNELEKSSFGIKSMQLLSEGLKGNLFNNKEEGFGSGSHIEASGFKKDTEYFWQFSSNKAFALQVWKRKNNNWSYDGIRWPGNDYRFYKAGFINPDFDSVYIRPYSFSGNNQITSAIMTVHGVKNGDSISSSQSDSVYGKAGTNTETFTIPATLKYAGQNVSRITCNKKAFPKLASFLSALKASGVLAKNNSYSGAYIYKYIKGTDILSNHSWGAAIDLFTGDSKGNALSYANTGKFVNDNPIIKELAQKHDIAWGGYWGASYDPMHFELVNPNF